MPRRVRVSGGGDMRKLFLIGACVCVAVSIGCGDTGTSSAGGGGQGGVGGAAGAGGMGGEGGTTPCSDDLGPLPSLTAQPTVMPAMVTPGEQIEVTASVSASATYVRFLVLHLSDDGVERLIGSIDVREGDQAWPEGAATITRPIRISRNSWIGQDFFLRVYLCASDACRLDDVLYTWNGVAPEIGEPYFMEIRDELAFPDPPPGRFSCYDMAGARVVAP